MKRILYLLCGCTLLLAYFMLAGCDNEKTGEPATLAVTQGKVTAVSGQFTVNQTGAVALAYLITEPGVTPDGPTILSKGVSLALQQTQEVTTPPLDPRHEYRVSVAALGGDEVYALQSLTFRTTAQQPAFEVKVDAKYARLKFKVTPDAYAASYRYAFRPAASHDADRAAFDAGTLEGIVQGEGVTPSSAEHIDLTPDTKFILYVEGTDMDGGKTVEEVSLSTAKAPVECTLKKISTAQAVFDFQSDGQYGTYVGLVGAAAIVEELGGAAAVIQMYYEMDMAFIFHGSIESTWELGNFPDHENLLIIMPLNADGGYEDVYTIPFTTPPFNPSAPVASLKIEVLQRFADAAEVKYDMDEATTQGYLQGVMKKTDYEKLLDEADRVGDPRERHVEDYLALFGTTMLEDETHTWPALSSDTDYVAVGAAFNENGTEGYAPLQVVEFRTLAQGATAGAVAAKRSAVLPYRLRR